MARKSVSAPSERRVLTATEQRSAIGRLEARIKELHELPVQTLQTSDDPPVANLEQRIRSTLAHIYGEGTVQYNRLLEAASLDTTAYAMGFGGYSTPVSEIREGVDRGRLRAIAFLQGEVDALKENLEFAAADATEVAATPVSEQKVSSDEVFVVHGRDEAAKETVARVIQRAGLKPVILHEQPNNGKTIIEKFEKYGAAAGFAVVIATPDDVGGLATPDPELRPRARQNVIGEMFWFAGRLGREKVCALVKGQVEMPSDFAGVVYTPMDDHGGWKAKLLQELDAAGYKNLNWPAALS